MAQKYKMVFSTVERYPTEGTVEFVDISGFIKKRSKSDSKSSAKSKSRKSKDTVSTPARKKR